MDLYFALLIAFLVGMGLVSPSYANDNVSRQAELERLVQRTQALDKEINGLQQQIRVFKKTKAQQHTTKKAHALPTTKPTTPRITAPATQLSAIGNPVIAEMPKQIRAKLTAATDTRKLLQARQKFAQFLKKKNIQQTSEINLELGGTLAGAISSRRSYLNKYTSDINLSTTTLSLAVEFNPWLASIIKLSYDSSGSVIGYTTTPYRVGNSRLFLQTANIILGDLARSPFYASAGQMIVPFGFYKGVLPSLSSRLGKTLQRTVVLGYQQPDASSGFNAAVYGFRGDARIYHGDRINNGGINLGYSFNGKTLKFEAGTSVIANIADSAGMQNTKAPFVLFEEYDEEGDEDFEGEDPTIYATSFSGFGKDASMELLAQRVPAIDIYSKFSIANFGFYGEYTGAARSFAEEDLTFNDNGARPQAFNMEASYQFKCYNHPTVVVMAYSRSLESLALNMPEQSYSAGLRVALMKHVNAGLIYRVDKNYALGNSATGKGLDVLGEMALGRVSNTLTAQLGLSF